MNRLGKLVTLLVLAFVAAAFLARTRPVLSEEAASPAVQELRIAAYLHLSGEFSVEGKAYREGIELAAAEINEKGGVQGKQIKVTFEDTKYDPAVTAEVSSKVLGDQSVIGAIFSRQYEVKKAGPALKLSHLPSVVLGDSSPELEQFGNFVFGIGPSPADAGRKALEIASDILKAKSTYILSTNDEWFSGATKTYFDGALKGGVSVLGTHTMNWEDKDFLAILSRVRNSGADVLYAPLANNLPSFAKQLQASDVQKPVIAGEALSASILQNAGKYVEGFYVTKVVDPTGPAVEAMKTAFQAKYQSAPAQLMRTALGYDAVKMFAAAVGSGAATREAIRDYLAKLSGFPGISGSLTMTEKGSRPLPLSIFQVRAGKLEPVEPAASGTGAATPH